MFRLNSIILIKPDSDHPDLPRPAIPIINTVIACLTSVQHYLPQPTLEVQVF